MGGLAPQEPRPIFLPFSSLDRASLCNMLSLGLSWLLSYFVATVWPTYASFKALGTVSSADDTQWLTYWVVYSFLTFFEAVATGFVSWFPLYYEARLLLVLWLVLPQTKGAQLLFERYICPLMQRYGSTIDPAFKQAEKVMNSAQVAQMVKLTEQYGPEIAQQAMQRAAEEAQRLTASHKQAPGVQRLSTSYPASASAGSGLRH